MEIFLQEHAEGDLKNRQHLLSTWFLFHCHSSRSTLGSALSSYLFDSSICHKMLCSNVIRIIFTIFAFYLIVSHLTTWKYRDCSIDRSRFILSIWRHKICYTSNGRNITRTYGQSATDILHELYILDEAQEHWGRGRDTMPLLADELLPSSTHT